jgi:hypothetical protein
MKKRLQKSLTGICLFIILIGSASVLVTVDQTFGYFGEPVEQAISWSEDIMALQMAIVILRCVSLMAFFGCLLLFIINFVHSIKAGQLFPRKSIPRLFVCAAVSFIYFLCNDNLHIVTSAERNFVITMESVIVPLVILVFAFMYKAAVQVSEENSLTI